MHTLDQTWHLAPNDKSGTAKTIYNYVGKGRQYKYLQPCTHSGSDIKIRGENDSKRQFIIILFENEALLK